MLYAVLGSSASYSVGPPESSTVLMTAAAVATLTSGNEQRYAETAAVLAIAVGAVCVLGWLTRLGFWPTACGSAVTCALRDSLRAPGSRDVRRRRNRAGRAPCRGVRLHTKGAGPDEIVAAVR